MGKKKQESNEGKTNLQIILEKLDKSYGKGTVMSLGDKIPSEYDIIPTGSIGLDYIALGVGGFVKGKLYELIGWEASGKSTLCGHVVAECQKRGGKALYIDSEHAVDPSYFRALGVDTDTLLMSQPSNGEEGFNVAMELIRSGEIDLVILDSDSSLLPKAVVDGDIGDSAIGKKAKLNSDAYPKLKSTLVSNNVCVIVISQYREKIGVMYGCLHGDNLIHFTDGRVIPIKDVVNDKIEGSVYTISDDGEIESRRITDWHNNGLVDSNKDFIHIETSGLDGQNTIAITVTPNHELLTDKGWIEAKDINMSHKLISKYKSVINDSLGDFLYGAFAGDCSIIKRDKTTANIRFRDTVNPEYLKWKMNKLSSILKFKKIGDVYHSDYTSEIKIIKDKYPKRDPMSLFDNYSNLGLAVWFMDDAHFDNKDSHYRYILSVKRFKSNINKMMEICREFSKRGIDCTFNKTGYIIFNKENTIKIAKLICTYVPESMQYKLPDEYKDKYDDFVLHRNIEYKSYPVNIKTVRFASDRQMRIRTKYDISVEENSNYMAGGVINGVIVHNSPNVTQGGHALKYYADGRIEMSKTAIKDKVNDRVIGNKTTVKVLKNKTFPPYRKCDFTIIFGKGIDKEEELVSLAEDLGVIVKSGSWFSYKESTIGQGIEGVKSTFEDNPELFELIKNEVIEKIKNG